MHAVLILDSCHCFTRAPDSKFVCVGGGGGGGGVGVVDGIG